MMRAYLAATLCFAAAPAFAGIDKVIEAHVLPGTEAFAEATTALASAATDDCTAQNLRDPYHTAFDSWLGISHLRLGPIEEEGRGLAISFWPDTRGLVGRTVAGLVADEDPVVESPEAFAEVSIAGRGLLALERLLFEDDLAGYPADSYACAFAQAIAGDLARMAGEIDREWHDSFAATLRSAGDGDNNFFLSEREAAQALYTALATGLGFVADQRSGRPMGTFEAPKPLVAEARRSGRSLRNVVMSLEALRELAQTLADHPIPETEAAFAAALERAEQLDDPVFAGVASPSGRLRVEALQTLVSEIGSAVAKEIAPELGVSVGFNSADGD